jgi:hypothetical protein
MRSLAICLALATPLAAQETMTGPEFDAYATGKTITFRTVLNPEFGVERYLPGQRVMWSAFDGTCQYGVWFESKGDICFRYEGDPENKCWSIYNDPQGLRGVYTTTPNTTIIYEVLGRDDPLICNDLSS